MSSTCRGGRLLTSLPMNRVLLAIVVAALVFAAVWTLRGGKEQVDLPPSKPAAITASTSRTTPTPDVVLSIKPGGSRPRTAPVTDKVSPLMRELANGPRKPLYDRLSEKSTRTPEENYVLARLLELCTEVTGTPRDSRPPNTEEARRAFAATMSEKDPDRAKRVAAFEKMSEPMCAGFEGMKTDPKRVKELIDAAAAGGDPKGRARVVERDVWAVCCSGGVVRGTDALPTITDDQLRTLQETVRTGDPTAMLIAGSILSSTLGDLMIRAGPEERPIDPRSFNSAWILAACDAGQDCGPNTGMLLQGCAYSSNCGAQNVEEFLYYYGNSPQQSQLINEYRSQLTRAMQTGDWSYFTFVRAAPPRGSVFFFRGIGGP